LRRLKSNYLRQEVKFGLNFKWPHMGHITVLATVSKVSEELFMDVHILEKRSANIAPKNYLIFFT